MMTGLDHSCGEYVFLIDVDLEEQPEWLEKFWHEIQQTPEVDVIYGVQDFRKGNYWERLSGAIFYSLINRLSPIKIPTNLVTCRLMSRRYVQALLQFKDQTIFLAGLWAATGFIQKPLVVKKLSHSPSTYGFSKKLAILINAISSFSEKPLLGIFYLGIAMTAIALIYASHLIFRKLVWGIEVEGWTSIAVSLWGIGGMIIFCLGVIGIYLAKIFIETKQRPYTIIKDRYAKDPGESCPDDATSDTIAPRQMRVKDENHDDNRDIGEIFASIDSYYTGKIIEQGVSPQGVDWNNETGQLLRFGQLLKVVDSRQNFSINDLGCGYGKLLEFMATNDYHNFRYFGYDLSQEMVESARELWTEFTNGKFIRINSSGQLATADYTLASGIFNVKMKFSDSEWGNYILQTLDSMNEHSRKGFAFNILTSYSDREYMRADLHYADPCFYFDYCKKRFAKNVTLFHDYGLYEFTIIVRKDVL